MKGGILYQLKRAPEAIESCQKALALDSQEAEAWFIEGVAYEFQNDFHNAIKSYNNWLKLSKSPDPRKSVVNQKIEAWTQAGFQ